ncbi:ABC transporter permease subunit [Telmatospirillum sp.]|uniref:ABC transporter permease n=1 Tax=Telmatospirillum sp. TaxID=2079197 RepID=UPI0028456070|nr:ABC transporter permease subunit [Telmatospirillum sp.]MDR3436746.1 ABC transporter permease subunit [Telmatospirillum sp.]
MGRRIINRRLGYGGAIFWGALPFLAFVMLYATFSALRLADNPGDKLLPAFSTIGNTILRLATVPDARTGGILLWVDTEASLMRLGIGLAGASVLGLIGGIAIGLIPYLRAGLSPVVAVISMVPPMAILPILFIVFGLDELSKVMLIIIGVAPFLIRDLAMKVSDMPIELLIKAQTLGASTWQIVLRVVLPQVAPKLVDAIRLSLGAAWLFLISAEAIAATDGLGYRIFLVRRYLAMDVILPYVAWITLLAFAMDWVLRRFNRLCFPWLQRGLS